MKLLDKAAQHSPQLRDLERKLAATTDKLNVAVSRQREAENLLADSLAREQFWNAVNAGQRPPRDIVRKLSKKGTASSWLLLSDWHVGQVIKPSKVNGLNKFDANVCEARAKEVVSRWLRLVDASRQISNIRHAVIWLGGDFISGHIHDELIQTNSMSPVQEAVLAQRLIRDALHTISKQGKFETIRVVCNVGNHGRTTKKMQVATQVENSYEAMMYWLLKESSPILAYWQIADGGQIIVDDQGHKVRCQHGHAIKYGGGIGGLEIPIKKAIHRWSTSHRTLLDIFGHFHSYTPNARFVVNSSLVGYDDYALSIGAEYQPPSQTMLVIDRERGCVEMKQVYAE